MSADSKWFLTLGVFCLANPSELKMLLQDYLLPMFGKNIYGTILSNNSCRFWYVSPRLGLDFSCINFTTNICAALPLK